MFNSDPASNETRGCKKDAFTTHTCLSSPNPNLSTYSFSLGAERKTVMSPPLFLSKTNNNEDQRTKDHKTNIIFFSNYLTRTDDRVKTTANNASVVTFFFFFICFLEGGWFPRWIDSILSSLFFHFSLVVHSTAALLLSPLLLLLIIFPYLHHHIFHIPLPRKMYVCLLHLTPRMC